MKKLIFLLMFISILNFLTASEDDTKLSKILNEYVRFICKENPEFVSSLGIRKSMGYPVNEAKYSYPSKRKQAKLFRKYKKLKKKLSKINDENLSEQNLINKRIFIDMIEEETQMRKFSHYRYRINHMFGIDTSLVTLLTSNVDFQTKRDIKNFLVRLSRFDLKIDNEIKNSNYQIQHSIIPPYYTIQNVENSVLKTINDGIEGNIIYKNFSTKIQNLSYLKETEKKSYQIIAKNMIKLHVLPAYKKYLLHLRDAKEIALKIPGVYHLPNGKEYYKMALKLHLTSDITPEEIHDIGKQEVVRIQNEMMEIYGKMGFNINLPFAEVESKWWSDTDIDEYSYPNNDLGKTQALKDYQRFIDEAKAKLPTLFSIQPKAEVFVKPVPEYMNGGPEAYYVPAALDNSTKGTFFIQIDHYTPDKKGMQTLAFHEAIPGHHFQIAIDNELGHETLFPHFTSFTAFREGWALYSEKLAKEHGWYKDQNYLLSHLNSELFRAVRLVLDTGMHYYEWTYDECEEYMRTNLGWSSWREICRYSVWPGQACAYKIGELKILELREKVQKELREKFDIREFHDAVLEHGEVPLYILEEQIEKYIKEKNRSL